MRPSDGIDGEFGRCLCGIAEGPQRQTGSADSGPEVRHEVRRFLATSIN